MLAITRRTHERVCLRVPGHADIWVQIRRIENLDKVRLCFDLPPEVTLLREEIMPPEERHGAQRND